MEEHTEAVLSYIKFCTDTVTVEKRIRFYPNQKPWMTRAVRSLLSSRDTAFRSGDAAQYSMARANLRRGIKAAKEDYKGKVEENLAQNNARCVWQGLQQLTNYKGKTPGTTNADVHLAEELNHFFARFEASRPPHSSTLPLSLQTTNSIPAPTLNEHQVKQTLRSVNPGKAAGPDGVLGKVLKACADQLSGS